MSIDEAIAHALEVAEKNEKRLDKEGNPYYEKCEKCATEHRQLAEWLRELKQLKEQRRWIPCGERQPEENGNYLAFYRTSDGTASLEFMMVDHCNAGGGWLHEENGRKAYEKVIAWMPLPEPYKTGSEDKE